MNTSFGDCVCVCVCACVRERERERERDMIVTRQWDFCEM